MSAADLARTRAALERRQSEAMAEWFAASRPDTRDAARKRYRRATAALAAFDGQGANA